MNVNKRLFQWKSGAIAAGQTCERRAHARVAVDLTVGVWRMTQQQQAQFRAVDLGPGGLRFRSSVPILPGEVVDLLIPVADRTPLRVGGLVTWSRECPEARGTYEGGVVFTRITPGSHIVLLRVVENASQRLTPSSLA